MDYIRRLFAGPAEGRCNRCRHIEHCTSRSVWSFRGSVASLLPTPTCSMHTDVSSQEARVALLQPIHVSALRYWRWLPVVSGIFATSSVHWKWRKVHPILTVFWAARNVSPSLPWPHLRHSGVRGWDASPAARGPPELPRMSCPVLQLHIEERCDISDRHGPWYPLNMHMWCMHVQRRLLMPWARHRVPAPTLFSSSAVYLIWLYSFVN